MIHSPLDLTLSKHASIRFCQRSIPLLGVDFVLEYGVVRPCGGGCESYSFDRRSWNKAVDAFGAKIARMERYRNLYVIVAADGTIVTAAWRH